MAIITSENFRSPIPHSLLIEGNLNGNQQRGREIAPLIEVPHL